MFLSQKLRFVLKYMSIALACYTTQSTRHTCVQFSNLLLLFSYSSSYYNYLVCLFLFLYVWCVLCAWHVDGVVPTFNPIWVDMRPCVFSLSPSVRWLAVLADWKWVTMFPNNWPFGITDVCFIWTQLTWNLMNEGLIRLSVAAGGWTRKGFVCSFIH